MYIDHKDPQRLINYQINTEKDDSSGSTIHVLFNFFMQFKEEDEGTEIRTGLHIKSRLIEQIDLYV